MTEPTQAQIEEAKQLRAKFAFRGSLDVYTNELASHHRPRRVVLAA